MTSSSSSSSTATVRMAATVLLILTAVQATASSRVTVTVRNALASREEVGAQCAKKAGYSDKKAVAYNSLYEFEFESTGDGDLYICAFNFDGLLHWFNIYVGTRDRAVCGDSLHYCRWKVVESGPCFEDTETCYKWDHTSIGDGH